MINELPTKAMEVSYKNIFIYICLFLLVAGGIGTALYFLVFRKKSCKADKDCKSGQTCVSGKCQPVNPPSPGGCDPKCTEGQTCNNGKCQAQPTTEVTVKNYDETQSVSDRSLLYYKFVSPVNNCKIKNITVHASGDVNNDGFILCLVNSTDGKEIYDSTKAVSFLEKYPAVLSDTSFSGNIDASIMDVTLNHIENIPILNKGDFIYINWTTNSGAGGSIYTYKTNDNTLAVSLTYTS